MTCNGVFNVEKATLIIYIYIFTTSIFMISEKQKKNIFLYRSLLHNLNYEFSFNQVYNTEVYKIVTQHSIEPA